DVELLLEIVALDLGHARESGRLARRVEQAIDSAELEYRSPHQARETLVVPDVQLDTNGAARVRCFDPGRYRLGGSAVEVSDHDVRAFLDETPGGGLSDSASTAD